MKYEITEYIQEVVDKMKNGWILNYDTSERPPSVYLKKGDEIESVSNWTLQCLWDNGLLNTDHKYPLSSYTLK